MSDKIKNGVIIVLVCIIAILVCFLIFVLGMKFANKENELIIKQDSEVKVEETKISYVEENDNVPYITLACFEVQNNEIKDFYNTNYQKIWYSYHIFKDVLFINLEKNVLVTPLEGSVVYLNYYIDLENNETLNVKDVLSKLNIKMNDFNTKCVGCTLDYLDFMVRLMPIGNLIYVENIELPSSFE